MKSPEGWSFDDKGWESEEALDFYLSQKEKTNHKEKLGRFDSHEALELYIKISLDSYTNQDFGIRMKELSKTVSLKVLEEIILDII